MKHIELNVLSRDADAVIEYLGRKAVIHFSTEKENVLPVQEGNTEHESAASPAHSVVSETALRIRENIEKLQAAAAFLSIELPLEPEDTSVLPGEAEDKLTDKMCTAVKLLSSRENEAIQEKHKLEETLNEAKSFANLDAPFADLDQLSYLTLRVGRLDPKMQAEMRENLADRAVIIPLGEGKDGGAGDRILAAASRKGRFALDSELKKRSFVPIAIPEGYQGVPAELLESLEARLKNMDEDLAAVQKIKENYREEFSGNIRGLSAAYLMASIVEQLKEKLVATKSIYLLSGWVPQDAVPGIADDLEKLTGGRVAIRSYNPEELSEVREGREKVPVSLKHGSFVKGFEGVVFSYGSPLYGSIDPTPFVAVFFTILFGIMFGDAGQGLVLLLAGILTSKRGLKALAGFRGYSTPLIAVGISSIVMGFLTGEVFASEGLLAAPTKAVTGFFSALAGGDGIGTEKILHLMPEKGSVIKLFYFFGFTIAVGIVLNSIGLVVNIVNKCIAKKYEEAFFSKTGLAGLLFFWYALFIAVRIILGGHFASFDLAGLIVPVLCIFFGPVIWRLLSGERPVLAEGLMPFIMEGFVEILETVSTYISNTVSFLRVGAFALSHAVLSFIVFTLSEMVSNNPVGPVFSLFIMIVGNAVIIILEGMIVAIQVVRLQYYEFFSKFFVETGVEFTPFRFRRSK
jgi:V/A-type H+-transporting ATPase subunit I